MGYKSSVRLSISKKGYNELIKYINKYCEKNKLDNDEILEILNYASFKMENKYQMYLGWDDIKWYHDYDDIMALESGLDYLKESNYTFRFSRMGENFDDIEEIYNNGKKDIRKNYYMDFPYLERFYNDDKMKNNLYDQDKLNNKIREQER